MEATAHWMQDRAYGQQESIAPITELLNSLIDALSTWFMATIVVCDVRGSRL